MFGKAPLAEVIRPYLQQLEKERLSTLQKVTTRKRIVITLYFLVLLGIAGYAYSIAGAELEIIVFGVVMLFVAAFLGAMMAGIYYLLTNSIKKKYSKAVKEKIYSKALQHYNSSIAYYPERYIEKKVFKNAKLFEGFNRYSGDDLCEGQLKDGRGFRFSELKVLHQSSDSDGDSKTKTIFKGLFYVVDMPRPLGASIKVVPDFAEQAFGSMGKLIQGFLNKALSTLYLEKEIIRFDDVYPEFEKEFKIYSDNEAVARQFINNASIAEIRQLQQHVGSQVYLAIQNDICLVGVRGGEFLTVELDRSLEGEVFLDVLEEQLHHCFTLLSDISKIGTGTPTAASQNPFGDNSKQENPFEQPINPQKKPSVNYSKSKSKDNPFLL